MKHPTYVSETGQKIPRIVIKQIERKSRQGRIYYLHDLKISGDLEEEVIGTLQSLRKKLKVK